MKYLIALTLSISLLSVSAYRNEQEKRLHGDMVKDREGRYYRVSEGIGDTYFLREISEDRLEKF